MDWFSLVILALATWRVSSLLVNEEGPLNIFYKLRVWSGIIPVTQIHNDIPNEHYFQISEGFFAQVLSCLWCCSIWVGAFWTLLLFLLPQSIWLAIPFALSAGVIFLAKALEKLDG